MSDEAYSLFAILGALASAVVLYLRWRQGVILKRLLRSLTEEQREQIKRSLEDKSDRG